MPRKGSPGTAEPKPPAAAETPRRSLSAWLKAGIFQPEATAFFYQLTQEEQLAVSPTELFEYHFMIVIPARWLSMHFLNLCLVFKLTVLVS